MDSFNDTIQADANQVQRVHEDLSAADAGFVERLVRKLADSVSDETVVYLDDFSVHTIDRKGDAEHSHINRKEVVSGDATAWFAVQRGEFEDVEQIDVQYGVYAGSNGDDFVYNPVEVEIIPK